VPTTADLLVDAAEQQIESAGLDGLTLRSIARRCGVSHAAPARHFNGVSGLLAALAARTFRNLTHTLDAHVEAAGDDPRQRLAAAGRGYVEFALANPGTYELIFRHERLDTADHNYQQASLQSFTRLSDLVAAAQASGWRTDVDHRVLTGLVWAEVHGFVSLWIQGALPAAIGTDDHAEIVEAIVRDVLGLPATNPGPAKATRSAK